MQDIYNEQNEQLQEDEAKRLENDEYYKNSGCGSIMALIAIVVILAVIVGIKMFT